MVDFIIVPRCFNGSSWVDIGNNITGSSGDISGFAGPNDLYDGDFDTFAIWWSGGNTWKGENTKKARWSKGVFSFSGQTACRSRAQKYFLSKRKPRKPDLSEKRLPPVHGHRWVTGGPTGLPLWL